MWPPAFCEGCRKFKVRQNHLAVYPLHLNASTDTFPEEMFGQLHDDLANYEANNPQFAHTCTPETQDCKGPSRAVDKKIASCRNGILVLVCEPSETSLLDIPQTQVFGGRLFTLQACASKSPGHFVDWTRKGENWEFHDGMDNLLHHRG